MMGKWKRQSLMLIKKLTYLPFISRLVWRFHLAGILRRTYYRLNKPHEDMLGLEIGDVAVNFYVRTPWELRSLDTAGDLGRERHVIEQLVSLVNEGDVMFDIGSNFGIYSIVFGRAVGTSGQVIAFEPEALAYDHLQENIRLNGLSNVTGYQIALGDYSGEEKLYVQHTGASRLHLPTVERGGYELVRVERGDVLVNQEPLPIPRIVKIDVEGFEWSVIKGLEKTLGTSDCKILCCEIHPPLLPAEVKVGDVLKFLETLGFDNIETLQRGTSEFHALAVK